MAKSLFERRLALGLTTAQVASLTGLSRQTVRNYEGPRGSSGHCVVEKVQRLISLYDRLERKAAKADKTGESNDGRL